MKMYLSKYIKMLEMLLNMILALYYIIIINITSQIGIHGKTVYNSTIDKIENSTHNEK